MKAPLNYLGSKKTLLPFISQSIEEVVGDMSNLTFAELFAGTGVVSRYFKPKVSELIVNDFEYYSYIINVAYLRNDSSPVNMSLINRLNNMNGTPGIIFKHYCKGGGSGRMYFSDKNGLKIDAVRLQIESWKDTGYINDEEYYVLLASLLEAADKVANTASMYGAYLKELKPSAQKDLILTYCDIPPTDIVVDLYCEDVGKLINRIFGDVLYLDPPYNQRQYGANYHILNTIALYDDFVPQGKTGLRPYKKSEYCYKGQVAKALEDLLHEADFRHIFLSYNDNGLLSLKQIENIMRKYGDYLVFETDYRRYKADNNRYNNPNKTKEYLHVLIK